MSKHVTAKVERARDPKGDERTSVIAYLRDLEIVARRECQCRDTIQIIASGRHPRGDHDERLTADQPLARSHRFSDAGNILSRNASAGNSYLELNLHE